MAEQVVAIDAGTHAVRCLTFDVATGTSETHATEELELSFPRPGWVEIDPEHVASATIRALRSTIEQVTEAGDSIVCIGLTNMRETAFAWRRGSQLPAYPGIMWMSQQSQPVVEAWEDAGHTAAIRERTGLDNRSFFFGSKIAWLLEQRPELRRQAAAGELAVGTLESWLLYRLTGGEVHATDVSNASRYQLMSLDQLSWDPELCDRLGIPAEALPDILPTSAEFGTTHRAVCGSEIPITGMVADQQSSLLGHGCEEPGDTKITYGTSGVVSMNCGAEAPLRDGLVTSVGWTLTDGDADRVCYEIEGSAFHSGYTVGWLAERLGADVTWSRGMGRSEADAEDRVYVVPSFSELGAPRWPRGSGAVMAGLRMDSTTDDLLRAGVEAMGFHAYDIFAAMDLPQAATCEEVRVDGGGAANDYLCQLTADLLERRVVRPSTHEQTSVGAAKAALVGLGHDVEQHFGQDRSAAREFEPDDDRSYATEGYDHWSALIDQVL